MNLNMTKWSSLKVRITLASLVIFVTSIWSFSFYTSRAMKADLQLQLGKQQLTVVSILAKDINQELDLRLRSLELTAGQITPDMWSNAPKVQKILEERIILPSLFNGGYFAIQADGKVIADFPVSTGRVGMNVSEKGWLIDALKGKSAVGKPVIGKMLNVPVFTMASPIRDSAGKVVGVLAGVVDLNKPNFLDGITDNKLGKTGGYVLIAPQHKLIVTATDKKRIMTPMPVPGVNPQFDRYIQGFEGFGRAVNSLGVDELTASNKIPVAGWFLIANTPISEAFEALNRTQQHILVATIFFTLLVGCLIMWVLKRQLSPILDTVHTLTLMSEGTQPLNILPVVRQDEIGQLVSGFNRLLNILQQREEDLRSSAEDLKESQQIAHVGSWRLDVASNKVVWSDELFRMYGFDPKLPVPPLAESQKLFTPASWERLSAAIQNAKIAGVSYNLELEFTRVDGSSGWMWAFGIPIIDDNGVTVGLRGVAQDITEIKRIEHEKVALEQQFQHTQKLESLGVLSGGIAHDFNNILAVIIGHCGLAKLRPDTVEEDILQIESAAERAAVLCRQMLAYAGKSQFIKTRVNMGILVDETVSMLKATLPQNVAMNMDNSASIPDTQGDASQLSQIVMNLVINASEAIGEKQGEVFVALTNVTITADQAIKDHLGSTIKPGAYICLEVTDTGCGMTEETELRIFEPFYTTKFPGRGLGMSAVLGIIRSHGGALQLTSQPGKGTTFKVYLPVHVSDTTADESARQPHPAAAWRGSGTILLAEDEAQVRDIAKIMLTELGFTVIAAVNGKEAFELYQSNCANITLVLADVGMPLMDGYELFRELKQLNPALPIIISSGFDDADVIKHIARENLAAIVSKPYKFEQLREVLKGVVEGVE